MPIFTMNALCFPTANMTDCEENYVKENLRGEKQMKNKIWYEIKATGNDYRLSRPLENETLAKVKSEGLAQIVAKTIREVYGDKIKVEIC